jgi:hypothetical protein
MRGPYPATLFPDFHSCETATKTRNTRPSSAFHRENSRPGCLLHEMASSTCTKSGHLPVDSLHLIEN